MLTAVHPVQGLAGLQAARGLVGGLGRPGGPSGKPQVQDLPQGLITSADAANELQGHGRGEAAALQLQLQPGEAAGGKHVTCWAHVGSLVWCAGSSPAPRPGDPTRAPKTRHRPQREPRSSPRRCVWLRASQREASRVGTARSTPLCAHCPVRGPGAFQRLQHPASPADRLQVPSQDSYRLLSSQVSDWQTQEAESSRVFLLWK